MRPMKESTYNAIKNRNMTGANRFNHEVLIDGYKAGYGEMKDYKTISVSGSEFADLCMRSDGKILMLIKRGNSLYLKTADNDAALGLTETYSGGDLFLTELEIQGRLLRLKNGQILLFTKSRGDATNPHQSKVYRSNNGLGTDFTLINTLFTTPKTSNHLFYWDGLPKPIQIETGTIFAVVSEVYVMQAGYESIRGCIYSSDDNGLNWIKLYGYGYSTTSVNGTASFAKYGNNIFVPVFRGGSSVYTSGFLSTDNGVTWSWSWSSLFDGLSGGTWSITTFANDDMGDLYMVEGINTFGESTLYKYNGISKLLADINTKANWELITSLSLESPYTDDKLLWFSDNGSVHFIAPSLKHFGAFREFIDSKFKTSSITISKSHGGASTATIQVNNKNGVVNPRNQDGPLYKILGLNKQIIIKQGYGDDLVDSFTGIIDSINMTTFPQLATLSLRDNLKKALDQIVTKGGNNVVKYAHQPIENIVTDLCNLCGLTMGYIESTGINIATEFNWQSYADAFQFLSDLASFEFLCDESGKFHFRRDYQPADMEIAWSFEEGVDIQDLSYEIDDTDLYRAVRVYGKSEDDQILVYNAAFVDAQEFNILPQKFLKIDATETSTMAELAKIAQRALATMRSRTRVIKFSAIAIPHLQVGDFIQLFESSTNTHEIYRLSAINLTMTKDSFTMSCTAYYYGDSLVPGELPADIAYQVPDPNLNLIPEMTSNTKPYGVARSSSVYKDWQTTYHPWRAMNTDDDDWFWDLNTKTGWIEYEFPLKHIVDKYSLKARQDLTWNKALPKDFTFEAFDGEKWIVLDTRTNQTNWGIYEVRTFKFTNTTPYAKYRLRVSANNGYVRTQLEQIMFYYGGGA